MALFNKTAIESELLHLNNYKQEDEKEIKLWRAVIIKALEDLKLPSSNKKYRIWKKQSEEWFNKNNIKFLIVCNYADISSDYVLKLASNIIKTR